MRRRVSLFPWLIPILTGILFLLLWKPFTKLFRLNWAALQTSRYLISGTVPARFDVTVQDAAQDHCSGYWLQALIAEHENRLEEENLLWRQAINCSSRYVNLVRSLTPDDLSLADYAVREHPQSASGWFWQADLYAGQNHQLATKSYQRALELEPWDSWGWLKLARLLETSNLEVALDAYKTACILDDPGKHACMGAGRVAEQLGDYRHAIQYYRLSSLPASIDKAERLEKEIP